MKWNNSQFGELDVEEQHILTFPAGIIGFESCQSFVIVNDEDAEPFRWLVSLDDPDIGFPLIDPAILGVQYDQSFAQTEATQIYVIATLSEIVSESTVNLKSPVVIDTGSRTGRQVVLDNPAFALQHPLFPSNPQSEGGR